MLKIKNCSRHHPGATGRVSCDHSWWTGTDQISWKWWRSPPSNLKNYWCLYQGYSYDTVLYKYLDSFKICSWQCPSFVQSVLNWCRLFAQTRLTSYSKFQLLLHLVLFSLNEFPLVPSGTVNDKNSLECIEIPTSKPYTCIFLFRVSLHVS